MTRKTTITVLLVEDHSAVRRAMTSWLESQGHRVLAAATKREGLALGRSTPFNLLIVDLKLPDGDGWELMRELSAEKPVVGIASSGYCTPADVAKSKACGFIEHLVKPYAIEEIASALTRAVHEINGKIQRGPRPVPRAAGRRSR